MAGDASPRRTAPISRLLGLTSVLALLSVILCGCGPAGRNELLEGQRLLSAGRAPDAVGPLREAVRAFSTNALACAQAWNSLGIAYHQMGQLDNAALCYKAALDKDLNLFAARYNRGYLFFERTNYQAAISELTTYTSQLPDDPAGWLLLGKALLRSGVLELAQQNLQKVRRLEASPLQQAEGLNALGVTYARRRKAPEAFQHLEAARNRVADYPPALLNEAILSQQVGDRAFALRKYQAYLEVAPNSPQAAALRALTNDLLIALAASQPPTNRAALAGRTTPPAVSQTALVARASPPAITVDTTAPPVLALAATSTPPALVLTTPPPRLVLTSAAPALVSTVVPPAEVAARESFPSNLVAATEPVPRPPITEVPDGGPILQPDRAGAPFAATNDVASIGSLPEVTAPEPAPLETVSLPEDPEFQPARDVEIASINVVSNSVATIPPAGATVASDGAGPSDAARAEPKKQSIIARLNPVSWFSSKEPDPEKERAKALEAQAAEEEKARRAQLKDAEKARKSSTGSDQRSAPPSRPPAVPSPPVVPTFPRYVYPSLPVPAPGDRIRADQLVVEGVRAHQAGRAADAQLAYDKAAQVDPANFNAQFNLAVLAFERKDWNRSLEAYVRALAIKPASSQGRYGLGLALERAGYPLDAAAEFERVIAAEPTQVEAHLAAANLYATTLADPAKARAHYRRVLELQPSHPQAGMIKRWLGPLGR